MIFSEKITELRKRSGLTQEQFGDTIGVSRQAVSKWEMAQSVPDINKVMAIAEFFEVPVDFLLKDDLDLDYLENKPITVSSPDPARKVITLEEAQDYFATHKKTARLVIITIFLLVLSPVAGYFLSLTENEKIVGIGIIIQIIFMLCAAVTIILAVWGEKRFKYFKERNREIDYGVKGVAEDYIKDFDRTRLTGILSGIVLLVLSVIPMLICAILEANAVLIVLGITLMLLMAAAGISCIVYVNMIYRSYLRLKNHK